MQKTTTARRSFGEILSDIRRGIENFRDRLKRIDQTKTELQDFRSVMSDRLEELRLERTAELTEGKQNSIPPEKAMTELSEKFICVVKELREGHYQQAVLDMGGVLGTIAQIELDMLPGPNI